VAVASTSADALRRIQEFQPDVTLVDIDLGNDSGFELAQQLATATSGARSRVILISATPEQDLVDLIDESPAIGFVSKSDLSALAITRLLARE
jgi:CheY-like chemotaxis protein